MWNASSLDVGEGGKKSFARARKGNVWKGFFESLDADLAQGRRRNEEERREKKTCIIKGNKEQRREGDKLYGLLQQSLKLVFLPRFSFSSSFSTRMSFLQKEINKLSQRAKLTAPR